MKKSLYFLVILTSLLFVSSDSFGQKMNLGYESWVNKAGSREFRYIRYMDVLKDEGGAESTNTQMYRTGYHLYNDRGSRYMIINAVHYKDRGYVQIHLISVNIAGERDYKNADVYQINLDEFDGLNFTEKGMRAALGSRMYEIEISFVSSKKEHLKIKQIMDDDATDRIHYKLDS
jgi:hypothetical protein